MNIKFIGDIQEVNKGLSILGEDLNIVKAENGIIVNVIKSDNLKITKQGNFATLYYNGKIQFFRALGLLMENIEQDEFTIEENPVFKNVGVSFDVSRNAVLTKDMLKYFFRKMAIMGINQGMMYTEDVYEIENEPFWGYLRGRYSVADIQELDSYADDIGIELIPCIQTLGHLERVIHWQKMSKYGDTEDVLMVDKPETYQLIEKMIVSARQGYHTNLIHVGMDEAMRLGLGNYLKENGYEDGFSIMQKHIAKVTKIAQSYGFRPMMWSDMYFRCASPDHNYYEDEIEIPQDIIDNAPDNIDLVYWDYYHHDKSFYDRYIKLHQKFKAKTLFAGGMWTWIGPAIDYDLFFSTSIPGLNACVDNHIEDVMITAWGDDGAETNFLTTLLGIQTYAEYSYKGGFDLEQIKSRFEFCVKADPNAFLDIAKFNKTPLMDPASDIPNPAKFLLYQDPFVGLFDKDIEGLGFCEHYESLVEVFKKHKENNENFRLLFEFYEKLANVLQYKSELGIKMMTAYRNKDDKGLRFILETTLPYCKVAMIELKNVWRKLWFSTNKAFGFELLDLKLGGMIARVESAELRLTQYLSKEIRVIEEYDEDRLYLLREENTNILNGMYFWRTLVSSSKI